MNQPMAIDELVSVAQAEAMGELDAPMMAIVLSSEQSYDLPINSLETDADKARWGLILRAAREHVEADAVAVLYPAWTTIRHKKPEKETVEAALQVKESARAHRCYSVSAGSNSGTPRLYQFWLYQ